MKRFLIWLYLAIPMLCSAQSNYLSGYIIKENRDTVRGYLDYQGRIFTPASLKFKKELNEKTEGYSVADCAGFGIDGKEYFERYTVNVSQAYTRVSNLKEGLDTTFKTEAVFLKVLSSGKNVTLFSYTDEIKERFYLKGNKSEIPYELFRAQFLEKNSYSVKGDYRFRNQILTEMSKHDGVAYYDVRKLDLLRYEKADLLKVVSVINGEKPQRIRTSGLRFFAGAGLGASKATYSGTHALASAKAEHKTAYAPLLTAGMDALMDPQVGRYVLRFEFTFFNSKNEISSSVNNRHTFDEKTLAFSPQFLYSFYNSKEWSAYAGLGAGLNFSAYSNSKAGKFYPPAFEGEAETFEEQKLEFVPFSITGLGRVGVVLNKRFDISAAYFLPAKITDYSGFSIRMQRMSFGVSYLFGN